MQIEHMPMVRVFFEKRGRAKYTSHLDTMRMFSRSLRRSGLPVWYTQGFNPHMYMTFALPIALGYESLCESVDLRLTKEVPFSEIVERLNAALPPDFRALSAARPQRDPKHIAWADYAATLVYQDANVPALLRKLDVFLAQPVIEVSKRTKKGEKTVDIKPFTQLLAIEELPDGMLLRLRCAAGVVTNIAPTLLLKAYYSWSNTMPDGVKILREAVFCDDMQPFA